MIYIIYRICSVLHNPCFMFYITLNMENLQIKHVCHRAVTCSQVKSLAMVYSTCCSKLTFEVDSGFTELSFIQIEG